MNKETAGDGNKLSQEQKLWVVGQLACCESPAKVREALGKNGGGAGDLGSPVVISAQGIGYYDPTTAAGQALPEELREFFFATRRVFLERIQEVPIANREYRLMRLQR